MTLTAPSAEADARILALLPNAEITAKRYTRAYQSAPQTTYDDYLSAAYYGLIYAARHYVASRGASFETFAYLCMDAECRSLLYDWKLQNGWRRRGKGLVRVAKVESLDSKPDTDADLPLFDNIPDPQAWSGDLSHVDESKIVETLRALCNPRELCIVEQLLAGQTFRSMADSGALGEITGQRVHQIWTTFKRRAALALKGL